MSKPGLGWTRARALNSDQNLGVVAKCPHCNQFHLRPGYCQALDPINSVKYPAITDEIRREYLAKIGQNTDISNDTDDTPNRKMPLRHRAETDMLNVTLLETNGFEKNDMENRDVLPFDISNSAENRQSVTADPFQSGGGDDAITAVTCVECGASFFSKRKDSRYCSATCRKRASRRK